MKLDGEVIWRPGIGLLDLWVRCTVRVRVRGLENIPARGPALLVANHVSFLDPAVLLAVVNRRPRRIRFLCVAEAFDKPVLGWLLRAGKQIPVGGSGEARRDALAAARSALARGEVVLIYPEGTIPSPGHEVRPQRGAGMLALVSGAPIVPIATRGLERERRPWRPWRRAPAVVVIGAPLDITELPEGAEVDTFTTASERCLEAVRALQSSHTFQADTF